MEPITNNANKVLCCFYKEFLERRKLNMSIRDSSRFTYEFFSSDKLFSKWHKSDIDTNLMELGNKKYISAYIGSQFQLTNEAIIYLENRFQNGAKEVIDLISKFIP
jgi:hypothetical protein